PLLLLIGSLTVIDAQTPIYPAPRPDGRFFQVTSKIQRNRPAGRRRNAGKRVLRTSGIGAADGTRSFRDFGSSSGNASGGTSGNTTRFREICRRTYSRWSGN